MFGKAIFIIKTEGISSSKEIKSVTNMKQKQVGVSFDEIGVVALSLKKKDLKSAEE